MWHYDKMLKQKEKKTPQKSASLLFSGFLKKIIYLGCTGSLWLLRLFSSCGKRGYPPVVVHGLLIAMATFVAENGL